MNFGRLSWTIPVAAMLEILSSVYSGAKIPDDQHVKLFFVYLVLLTCVHFYVNSYHNEKQ